jgi:DNA-binding NarL/FixJ family response regulator
VSPPPRTPARILIVDDHPILRLGLRHLLEGQPDLSIAGEADSAESAIRVVRSTRVDLALVDLSLSHATGLDLVRDLHALDERLLVLVFSVHDEALYTERALRAGARGYVTKYAPAQTVVAAIRRVLSGHIYVSERASQHILESYRRGAGGGAAANKLGGLTDRELQVLEMIGKGLNTAGIAERLRVSVKTIETYRANIRSKLELKDATDLVRYAMSWVERL